MSRSRNAPGFDGWALPGSEVTFIGRNGHDHQLEEAMELFKVGQRLTVTKRHIGDWSSSYQFEGFGNKHFNTVMFRHDAEQEQSA